MKERPFPLVIQKLTCVKYNFSKITTLSSWVFYFYKNKPNFLCEKNIYLDPESVGDN